MKRSLIALLLAAALALCACSGAAAPSSGAPSEAPPAASASEAPTLQPAELPIDETVLGTVFGEEVPYTDYRLYLDLEDRVYLDTLRQEMALTLLLEEEMAARGIAPDDEAFKAYAAEAYYSEMLSEPRLIDEINAACEMTGLMGEPLDLALYEAYRQGYYIEQLGDHFSDAYRRETAQGETADEEYEAAAVDAANEKLYALAGEIAERIEIPADDQLLARIDGREIPLENRHKAYLILAVARNRINLVNSILIGEGIRHEIAEANGEEALAAFSEYAEEYRAYLAPTLQSEEFAESYGGLLEREGATVEQLAESVVRSFATLMGGEEAYYELLHQQYEALAQSERPETFEEYAQQRYETLYEQCVAVHPMG